MGSFNLLQLKIQASKTEVGELLFRTSAQPFLGPSTPLQACHQGASTPASISQLGSSKSHTVSSPISHQISPGPWWGEERKTIGLQETGEAPCLGPQHQPSRSGSRVYTEGSFLKLIGSVSCDQRSIRNTREDELL